MLLLAGCATPGLPGSSASDFSIPAEVAGFRLESEHDFPDRALGFMARYVPAQGSGIVADVFVYPVLVPEMFSLADALDAGQAQLEHDVLVLAPAHGLYEKIELRSRISHRLDLGGSSLGGIWSYFDAVEQGYEIGSTAFLAIRGPHYYKLRGRYLREHRAEAEAALDRFLHELLPALQPREPEPGKLGVVVTRTTWELAGHDVACAAIAWGIGYGSEMASALAQGEYLDSFERELRARAKALELWQHGKREGSQSFPAESCVDSSLDAMLEVRDAGFLREYVWSNYAKDYWERPPGLRLDAYLKWSRAELPEHDVVPEPGVVVRYDRTP